MRPASADLVDAPAAEPRTESHFRLEIDGEPATARLHRTRSGRIELWPGLESPTPEATSTPQASPPESDAWSSAATSSAPSSAGSITAPSLLAAGSGWPLVRAGHDPGGEDLRVNPRLAILGSTVASAPPEGELEAVRAVERLGLGIHRAGGPAFVAELRVELLEAAFRAARSRPVERVVPRAPYAVISGEGEKTEALPAEVVEEGAGIGGAGGFALRWSTRAPSGPAAPAGGELELGGDWEVRHGGPRAVAVAGPRGAQAVTSAPGSPAPGLLEDLNRATFYIVTSGSSLLIEIKDAARGLGRRSRVLATARLSAGDVSDGGSSRMTLPLLNAASREVGELLVQASYTFLRGTRDSGTRTGTPGLTVARPGRARRGSGARAALESSSQVSHKLCVDDSIFVLPRGDEEREFEEGGGIVPPSAPPFPSKASAYARPPPLRDTAGREMARRALGLEFDRSRAGSSGTSTSDVVHPAHPPEALEEVLGMTAATGLASGEAFSDPSVGPERRPRISGRFEYCFGRPAQKREIVLLARRAEEAGEGGRGGEGEEVGGGAGAGADEEVGGAAEEGACAGGGARAARRVGDARSPGRAVERGPGSPSSRGQLLASGTPCFLGSARTDSQGRLPAFDLGSWVTSRPGHIEVTAFLPDDATFARGSLFVLAPGTRAVVFDLDGTLTRSNAQVAAQLMLEALGGSTTLGDSLAALYDPKPRRGALMVARAYAAKGYQVVYLSARYGALHALTVEWLARHKYPPGPVRLRGSRLPSRHPTALYKAGYLRELQAAGVEVIAAYGNALSDAIAYRAAGVPEGSIYLVGKNAGRLGSVPVRGWTHHVNQVLESLPEAPVPTPYVEFVFGEPPRYAGKRATRGTVASAPVAEAADEGALRAAAPPAFAAAEGLVSPFDAPSPSLASGQGSRCRSLSPARLALGSPEAALSELERVAKGALARTPSSPPPSTVASSPSAPASSGVRSESSLQDHSSADPLTTDGERGTDLPPGRAAARAAAARHGF